MAKAELHLPSGAKVMIEGTEEEVKALLDHYSSRPADGEGHRLAERLERAPVASGGGPTDLVRELIASEFFATKRSLGAIEDRLAEEGHIYPQTTLSGVMIKLTKRRELRRLKEKGAWVYVNR